MKNTIFFLVSFLCIPRKLYPLIPESYTLERINLWPNISCHAGTTALSKDAIKKITARRCFHRNGLEKSKRCMNILKNNNNLVKKIAGKIKFKE